MTSQARAQRLVDEFWEHAEDEDERLDVVHQVARLMGHTATQHAKTYRAHIQPHQVAEAAERALGGL